jgi:Ni,Fe-hydrogenase I cytochrome b subunit
MGLLLAVATCGVTVSAIANSTMLGIALLWVALYGVGFALYLLPAGYVSPVRVFKNLPHVLQGFYDLRYHGRLVGWSLLGSVLVASVGLGYFGRRDV